MGESESRGKNFGSIDMQNAQVQGGLQGKEGERSAQSPSVRGMKTSCGVPGCLRKNANEKGGGRKKEAERHAKGLDKKG